MRLAPRMVVRVKVMNPRPGHWNSSGKMDKYMGQIVTIKFVSNSGQTVHIEGPGERWTFHADEFESLLGKSDPNLSFMRKKHGL